MGSFDEALAYFFLPLFFPALVEALVTDEILLGSWLTLEDSLDSSEDKHKGKVDGMLLTLGLKVGTSEGAREGKTEGKAEAKATDGDWLGHPSPNRIDVSDLPNSPPSAMVIPLS